MGILKLNQYFISKISVEWLTTKHKIKKYNTGYYSHTKLSPTTKEVWKRGSKIDLPPFNKLTPIPTTRNEKCIQQIGWEYLHGKSIVIDISIYLYKFEQSTEGLLHHLNKLLNCFEQNKIRGYFIFDGKPPIEKKNLIRKRCWERKQARQAYEALSNDHTANPEELNRLRLQQTRVSQEKITQAKDLIKNHAANAFYYEAPEEADEICVLFVRTGLAYACMSDDMDMFLFGCPRVIRCYQLATQYFLFYDTNLIFKKLNITLQDLQQICLLTGESDYQYEAYQESSPSISLETAFEYHTEYRLSREKYVDFLEFLIQKKGISPIWINYIQKERARLAWIESAVMVLDKKYLSLPTDGRYIN